jgi:EpsI family protein
MTRRVVFIGFSIVVPIIANWIRAYMIVMIGHLSSNKLAVGVDHLIYGWLFFGIVIMLMFWIGARWRDDTPVAPSSGRSFAGTAGAAASSGEFLLVAVVIAIGVMVWPLGGKLIERSDAASLPALSAPVSGGGWRAEEGALTSWRPQFQNPSAQLNERWTEDSSRVGVYIGYYRNQSADQKLVSSDNSLVKSNDRDWIRIGGRSRRVEVDGQPVDARVAELRGPADERLLVWYWYWIDGKLTASDMLAKLYTALARLTGRGDDSAVVIVYTRRERPGEAEATLDKFLRDAGPTLEKMLDDTRARR